MKPAAHQYEDKLLEFAYGELPAPEASAVEAHVQGCARCTQALGEIRAVRMTMGKLPEVEAPDAGLESLLAYAEQAARRNAAGPAGAPSWLRRMMAPLSAVAALSVLAVVGWKVSEDSAGELMPAPAVVALKNEEKVKDLRRAEPATLAEAAPKPAEPPAPAAAAPVAQAPAAGPEEAQAWGGAKAGRKAAGGEADDFDQAFGGERGGYEQRYGETVVADKLGKTQAPPEAKSDLGDSLKTASKLSKSKRAAPARAEELSAQEESKKAEKESVALRDAKPAAAPPPPPAQASSQQLKGGGGSNAGGFGLGVGNAGTRERAVDFDDAEPVGSVASGAPGGARAQQQAAPSAAPVLEAQSAARGDVGVSDKKRVASDSERMLSGARQARARNDRTQEIQLALQALKLGAQGEQRAEALQHACEGYEALGDEGRAGQFCDLLLREFPNTLSARRIAERRSAPQLSPSKAPARAKKEAQPAAADELQKPAEPKQAAPASRY